MKIRNVLSLFDGISCGQVALRRVGIIYDKYYASEIDKNAIYITQYNFPNTVQLGDVEKWKEWNIDWSKIDLLIGGSPCTNLSIAGNREGLEGEESRLFYSFVDILNHIKKFNPNVKFLLENVESMSDKNKGIINNYMGCKPIMINSALLSAQNRKRYYWVNWCLKKESLFGLPSCVIPQPKDKGILLKDILETSIQDIKEPNLAHYLREFGSKGKILLNEEKSSTLTAAMGEGGGNVPCVANEISKKYYSGRIVGKPLDEKGVKSNYEENPLKQIIEVNTNFDKTNTLTTVEKDNIICEPICVNSQSGRRDGKGKQPFVEDRIYSVEGKGVALNTNWHQNIAEPLCPFVEKKYEEFAKENGYIPVIFNPFNKLEIIDKSPTQTTTSGSSTTSSSVMIFSPIKIGEIGKGGQGMRIYSANGKSVSLGAGSGGSTHERYAYEFCEGDRNKNTELDYVGGIISGRDKWIKDEKNYSRNFSQGNRVYSVRGKSVCLSANGGGLGSKTGLYKINLPDGDYIIRKLTPVECERLQTVPDNYTKYGFDGKQKIEISNNARYKALGNGWTIDVIAYIFEFLV